VCFEVSELLKRLLFPTAPLPSNAGILPVNGKTEWGMNSTASY